MAGAVTLRSIRLPSGPVQRTSECARKRQVRVEGARDVNQCPGKTGAIPSIVMNLHPPNEARG